MCRARDAFGFRGAALERLAREPDPELGAAVIAEFSLAHPATRELLRAAVMVEPAPRGLVDAMVAMLESMHDPVRATAIELLVTRTSAADVARWHGPVARVLARTPRPEDYVLRAALSALGTAARVDVAALPVLACWATGTEPVELRGMAVAALASASSAVDEQIPEALRAAARPLALAAFTATLARSEDDAPFRTAARAIAMTERDGAAASRLYADAVLANPHAAARVFLLGQMESQWSAARAEVPRIELLTCDDNVDVRAAATAALARIAPAHRAEAAARTAAAADPRAAPAVSAPGATQVDWLAYGEAFKAGQEAALRKLVDRGNVNLPMTMLGKATVVGPPINGVLSYCGFPQIPEAHLVVAIRLLVDLGADPTVRNNGAGDGSTMDYAVLACPPAVQAALGIR